MAGRRKPPKRDYAAEYARRQARARELGYGSYYERRTRPAPGAPKPPSSQLRRRRGHAGRAALVRALGPGSLLLVEQTERDESGRLTQVRFLVVDDEGTEQYFWLRGRSLDQDRLDRLVDEVGDSGAVVSPTYPLKGLQRAA